MRCRHGYLLLMLVTGLAAPAGCVNWQCFPQPLFTERPPAANARSAGELTPAQAAQLCLAAGEDLEKSGFTAEAIRQLENARRHDPAVRGVSRHLAVLYDLQGEPIRAENEYRQALEEQKNNAELLNDFGYFHYRYNHLQMAESWLRIALTVDPKCKRAWVNLGQVLACQGRGEESFRAFAHVLRPAEACSNLGVLLAKQGNTAEARRVLEQALALEPGLQQPRAFLHALNGNVPEPLGPDLTRNTPAPPSPAAQPAPPLAPLARSLVQSSRPAQRPARPQAAPLLPEFNPTLAVPPPCWPLAVTARLTAASRPVSEGPSIANGPSQPAPLAPPRSVLAPAAEQAPATPAKTSPEHKSPPDPPPHPAPLPSFVPPPPRDDEGPTLIPTSAIEMQPPVPDQTPSAEIPLPVPVKPAFIPQPAKRSARPSPPPPLPKAVLPDCQNDPEQ
jgi:Tfp pilus assembly protein PilF